MTKSQVFQAKPVQVSAMQFLEDNHTVITDWLDEGCADFRIKEGRMIIRMDGNWGKAYHGDWIVMGIDGEFIVVDNDIFEATYEERK